MPNSITPRSSKQNSRIQVRVNKLNTLGHILPTVTSQTTLLEELNLSSNIENPIGMAMIPIGIAGPLKVNGSTSTGEYIIPLATTEGALVASYSRGMKACYLSGGITSICIDQGMQRSPFFKFDSVLDVNVFVDWVMDGRGNYDTLISEKSNYAKLKSITPLIEGNTVILDLTFATGDAAGQNMVTICTDHLCQYLITNCPTPPTQWYVESNYSGDKKATHKSLSSVRGRKVVAEITLTREVVNTILHSTPDAMTDYWRSSTLATMMSGAIGANGHIANGLTALFIACGQDVACVAEAAIGVTRMEVTDSGDLYISLTLPSLPVGTVGGGTHLPTQKECLQLLDCYGAGKVDTFAELCGATALAGEISIAAALAQHHFTSAHRRLGRPAHAS